MKFKKYVYKKISLKNLFKLNGCDNFSYFEEQKCKYDIKIKTPTGYKKINYLIKKNNINCVKININNSIVKGADKHLIKISNEWETLDSFNHDKIEKEDLYDVSVDFPHEYLTSNNIIHHNTSTAKAICKDLDADYSYINASLENGIDVLRSRIERYASTISTNGQKKIVIMDESENLSQQVQLAFRAFLEEFHNTCRFIFTCNYITKIIEPIQSRCSLIDFNLTDAETVKELKPQIIERLCGILKTEKIEFNEETISKLVDKYYPDMRQMLGILQKFSKINKIINNDIFNYATISTEIVDLILKKQFTAVRTYIIEKNYAYDELYRFLYDNLLPQLDSKQKYGKAILIIAEYMYKSAFVIDKEINFASCLLELMSIV